ncbi:hypothetical protein AB0C31_12555, partial [Actinoplanes philippinensis]
MTTLSPDSLRQHTRRRPGPTYLVAPLLIGVSAGAGLLATYHVFVRTISGQWLDTAAMLGTEVHHPRLEELLRSILNATTLSSLVLVCLIAAAVGVVRKRLDLAIAAAVLVLAGNATTQLLKDWLPRPTLDGLTYPNSLPSGHTTAAASVAFALVIVVPAALRGPTALVGAGYTAAIAIGTVWASRRALAWAYWCGLKVIGSVSTAQVSDPPLTGWPAPAPACCVPDEQAVRTRARAMAATAGRVRRMGGSSSTTFPIVPIGDWQEAETLDTQLLDLPLNHPAAACVSHDVQPTDLADPTQNPDAEEPTPPTSPVTPVASEDSVASEAPEASDDEPAEPAVEEPAGRAPGRIRRILRSPGMSYALNILAGGLVFVALLYPNVLRRLTLGNFARIPIEAAFGILLLIVLPRRPRLVVGSLLGAGLGWLLIQKSLDMGWFKTLARPFDVILDWELFDDTFNFIRDSYGAFGA